MRIPQLNTLLNFDDYCFYTFLSMMSIYVSPFLGLKKFISNFFVTPNTSLILYLPLILLRSEKLLLHCHMKQPKCCQKSQMLEMKSEIPSK